MKWFIPFSPYCRSVGQEFCGEFVAISNHWPHPHVTRVVQGAVAETTALLNNRWDHIFYTGAVGLHWAQCHGKGEPCNM